MIPLRKEVRDFARSCEKLLSLHMATGDEPLSEDERHLIIYYLDELRQLTTSVNAIPKS
ncbi:MAG: hypothetical protein OJF51_002666 [Nitrospira sp.]|jgi:hypothetical protein|nr:MAG: hypothetical protein OJF51_002666 [Nitrospira sp.]